MIKVLVAEDSKVVQALLCRILEENPNIKVIAVADNGEDAVRLSKELNPDVITMDIVMPRMNGLEAIRIIMESDPVPIVVVSASWKPEEVEKTFSALEAGAVSLCEKPTGITSADHWEKAAKLLQTVRLMSEVKVVRRPIKATDLKESARLGAKARQGASDYRIAAVGASTGGPPVLATVLSGLPSKLAFPLLIVQHISPGFIGGLAEWLSSKSSMPVTLARNGEKALPGHAYLAPDDIHLEVEGGESLRLARDAKENGMRPSVSRLFHSVNRCYGDRAIGILLTGMGQDGVDELLEMHNSGALTLAQDRESSVVHGMPGKAISLGAVSQVLSPHGIAEALASLSRGNHEKRHTAGQPDGPVFSSRDLRPDSKERGE